MRPEVDLIPLDDIETDLLEQLKKQIKDKGCVVRLYARTFSPKTAANMYRKQYMVDVISDALSKLSGKVIAVTDKDLYSNRLNYVFCSVKNGGPAVISIHRLRPEYYLEKPDPSKVIERLVKETIYCIGRMNGMKDCPNPRCIMCKVNSTRDIDFKSTEFCKDCKINNVVDSLRV